MTSYRWKNGVKVEAPEKQHYTPHTTFKQRRWVKARQCATVYKINGIRCNWPAMENSLYCRKHGQQPKVSKETIAKMHAGRDRWWARMREIEAKAPGTLKRIFSARAVAANETRRKTAAVQKLLPAPETDDKIILKAHKTIVREIADLPAVPNKPFDEMAPHEQMVVNTKIALTRAYEILRMPYVDKKSKEIDYKVLATVKDAAFRTIGAAVKIDRNALAARKLDRMAELLARLKAGEAAKLIEG
jgi:hypothetical protein